MSELKNHICCPYFGSEFREKRVKNRVKRDFLISLENHTVSLDFSLNSDSKLDSKSDLLNQLGLAQLGLFLFCHGPAWPIFILPCTLLL